MDSSMTKVERYTFPLSQLTFAKALTHSPCRACLKVFGHSYLFRA